MASHQQLEQLTPAQRAVYEIRKLRGQVEELERLRHEPVAIIGMRELLPMGSMHLRSGKVIVRVGDPISTKGMTIADREELTARLHGAVAEMLAK